jgi:3-hydroxyisobutyrate dehydrogenase-like beta-hydroxyacid dehydrogenase
MDPEASRTFALRLSEKVKGARMLDCPVSGSTLTVQLGKAVFMVGGKGEDFEKILPLLLDLGCKATHVGDNGKGLVLKLAVNVNLAIQMQGLSEGVVLAEKAGIARSAALDVFLHSAVASPMVQYRGPFINQLPHPAWFSCDMMQKDMELALQLSRQVHTQRTSAESWRHSPSFV